MERLVIFSVLLFSFLLTACQSNNSATDQQEEILPEAAPEFSISSEKQELEVTTKVLCWEECEELEQAVEEELGEWSSLVGDSPIFHVAEGQQLSIDLFTDRNPTRYSYSEYNPNSGTSRTISMEEDSIEITGTGTKTYLVQAEWYGENEEELLGSIYTVFTLDIE